MAPLPRAPYTLPNVQILSDSHSSCNSASPSPSLSFSKHTPTQSVSQSVCCTCNHSRLLCLLLLLLLGKHVSNRCMQIQLSRCNCTWLWPKTCSLDASLVPGRARESEWEEKGGGCETYTHTCQMQTFHIAFSSTAHRTTQSTNTAR